MGRAHSGVTVPTLSSRSKSLKTSPPFMYLPPLLPKLQSSIAGYCYSIARPRSSIVSSHTLGYTGAALGHQSRIRSLSPGRLSLRCATSEISVPSVSSATIASIFEPRHPQRIGGTARSTMPGQKRDQRLEATLSERRYCGIFVGAARQTREDYC